MATSCNRRQAVKTIVAVSVATAIPKRVLGAANASNPQSPAEVQITSISPHTMRLLVLPVRGREAIRVREDGSLVRTDWGAPVTRIRDSKISGVKCGELFVRPSFDPLTISIESAKAGEALQRIRVDPESGAITFTIGDSPLLGLGEGGVQFDRRGSVDRMKSGQGGYKLRTHGGRVPIPWLISTAGWAMFIHQPYGSLDLTGSEGKFHPFESGKALPVDIFFVASKDPSLIMAEYARLTGHPELPPLWSLGYQQSHRTLASREEVLSEAKSSVVPSAALP